MEPGGKAPDIAIAGAGAAGLACASVLADHGVHPVVFEKSRGIGGRMSTRRCDGLRFDHGAQFLALDRDPLLARLQDAGAVAPWPAAAPVDGPAPWVGTPRMKDMLAPLAAGQDIRFGTEIRHVTRAATGWQVATDDASHMFDAVVLASAAPQSLRVLDGGEAALRADLERVEFAPCHALMVSFAHAPAWPDIQRAPPDPFVLIVREGSKPGRSAGPACFVAHTTAAWSAARLDTPADDVAAALLAALADACGPLPPVDLAMGHRWRFSQATRPLGRAYAQGSDDTLLAAGDWALGRNVEDALASGRAAAQAICARFGL